MIKYFPIFPECPRNPARTDMLTGDIEINMSRWRELNETDRLFVLLHEQGHWNEQTFDEVKADRYALRHLALKRPYSLWNYLKAVDEVSYGNTQRVNAAQHDTLEIAASNGSKEAKEMLKTYASADGSSFYNKPIDGGIVILEICMVCLIIVGYGIYKKW